jgi:hypothetical protein
MTTIDLDGWRWDQASGTHACKLSNDLVSFQLKIVVIEIDVASAQIPQGIFSGERSAVWEICTTVRGAITAIDRYLGIAKQLLRELGKPLIESICANRNHLAPLDIFAPDCERYEPVVTMQNLDGLHHLSLSGSN